MIVSLTILCAIADTFAVAGMFLMLNDAENGATFHRTLCIHNPGPAILLCGSVAQPGRTLRQGSCLLSGGSSMKLLRIVLRPSPFEFS